MCGNKIFTNWRKYSFPTLLCTVGTTYNMLQRKLEKKNQREVEDFFLFFPQNHNYYNDFKAHMSNFLIKMTLNDRKKMKLYDEKITGYIYFICQLTIKNLTHYYE